MRSKTMLLALTVGAVVAVGLFLPNFTYAGTYSGQIASSQAAFGPLASNLGPTAPILTVRDGHGHGGSWQGAARSFHGGRGFHRGFYGGGFGYAYPYYDQYYVGPSCDSVVWDSDLDEWVCANDYDVY